MTIRTAHVKPAWSDHRFLSASVVFLLIFLLTTSAFAQAYKPGRASLMKSDYRGAEAQLSAATKIAKSKNELAETYKYLGVAQYMRGNKAAAYASFVRAKALNPSVKLTANEVADESVIPVFASAKASAKVSSPPATAGRSRSPLAASRAPGIAKQKSKRTLLKVLSNVPSARVSLDGIAYGSAGQEIEVQPGTVVLEVSSPGYKTKAIKVQLEAMTASSVTVNLDKLAPKPKPQPLRSQPSKGIPLPGMTGPIANNKQGPAAGVKKPKNDLFGGDDSIDDFSQFQQQPMASRPQTNSPQIVTPPGPPQQPVMPPQGYGTGPYGQQPAYPQSPYVQSPYSQAPFPQQPYTGYPMAPVYPAYPTYQAPAFAPAPYPMQPYGVYAAPTVNPYAYTQPAPPVPPPSPVYSAPADPYGGYLGPPPESPTAISPPAVDPGPTVAEKSSSGMPPPPILPPSSSSGSGKRSVTKAESCSTLVKILPFGFGQFCKGSTAKGLFFLGSEAGALYFYKSNTDAATSFQSRLNQILAEREAARADIPADEQEAFDIETSAKESQGKAAINKARQNAQYSMLAFVGLWGAGVFDAMTSPDASSSGKSKKGKRSKPRIMHSYHLDLDTAPLGTVAMDWPIETRFSASHLDSEFLLGYTPIQNPRHGRMMHALTMGVTWDL